MIEILHHGTYVYIYIYIHICSPPLRHAKMHILPIYPEQLLGNDCENPKIQKSSNPKKLQDSVDVNSFGCFAFWSLGFLDFWILEFWRFLILEF